MPGDCHPLCTRRHHWRCRLKGWALGPVPRIWLIAVIVFSVAGAFTTFTLVGRTAAHNCRSIEAVKTVIRQVEESALAQIGQPHTAGYLYYSMHPDELAAAKADILRQEHQFARRGCPSGVL